MKKNILKYMLLGGLFLSCTPEDPSYTDNDQVDVNTVTSVTLHPNHRMVLADGRATLDLCPALFRGDARIPDHRVDSNWLEFFTLSGQQVDRRFTTSDAGLCGTELKVYARLKGKAIYSDTVAFTVTEPLATDLQEMEIPVVFHIIQTTEDIVSYGGKFTSDRIEQIMSRLNNAFSALVSANPVGVDTKIRFRPALYDPQGRQLDEPGIHRIEVTSIPADNLYADFLKAEKAVWTPDRYMNIWLISDGTNSITNFGYTISRECRPRYTTGETTDVPEGLELTPLPEGKEWEPKEAGLIYKLQLFNLSSFTQGKSQDNVFIHYVGNYLGLLPTWGYLLYGNTVAAQDYCADTQKYTIDQDQQSKNTGWEKTADDGYTFTAENIMDDQISLHRSVSRDQCLRMRWVLQHCPERAFWKSRFAFEGK